MAQDVIKGTWLEEAKLLSREEGLSDGLEA